MKPIRILSTKIFCLLSLNAYIVNDNISIELHDVKYSPNDEVLVECSNFKTKLGVLGLFNSKQYSQGTIIQSLMEEICDGSEDKKIIKIQDILKILKNVKYSKLKLNVRGEQIVKQKEFVNEDTLIYNIKSFNFEVYYHEIDTFVSDKKHSVVFPFIKLSKGTKLDLEVTRDAGAVRFPNKRKIQSYTIQEYIYDIETRKISSIVFTKPFIYKSKVFTNTYHIDDKKECIDGDVRVKNKRRKLSALCGWIEPGAN